MKKFLFFFSIFLLSIRFYGQYKPSLIIDMPLGDYPYSSVAQKTVAHGNSPDISDFFKAYGNPSMYQSLAITSSFLNVGNFLFGKINFNLTRSPIVNSFLYSIALTGMEVIFEYTPGGISWVHEEFHRAVLTKNGIDSHDEVNDFKFFASIFRVNDVTDEELIRFKSDNPQDFVRLHAAGIEGENVLAFRLYEYNFFYEQNLPYYVTTSMSLLNDFFYIWLCHRPEAQITTEQENAADGTNIKVRDFTGLDFTAWVYDLNRPFEPYENRGIHPSGVGIDRYIKPSDLTYEELKLINKEAFLNLLNLASPFVLGINRIPFKQGKMYFNFSFRHLLTSFGDDIGFYFFLKNNKFNWVFALHRFENQNLKFLPGLQIKLSDYQFDINNIKLINTVNTYMWLQPENLLFTDTRARPGIYFSDKLAFKKGIFMPYLSFSAKTNGWVPGEVFQEKNFSFRFGLSLAINKKYRYEKNYFYSAIYGN